MKTITQRYVLLIALALCLAAPHAPAAGDPAETKTLLAVLQSGADQHEKGIACRRLAVVGAAEAVPALAALLSDAKLAHMARFALEAMPQPEAAAALRDALATLKGNLLVGVINSIGMRHDAAATGKLVELLNGPDADVAAAAAAALSRIGGDPAAKALTQALAKAQAPLRANVADAMLVLAEGMQEANQKDAAAACYDAIRAAELPVRLRQAALQGAILARGDSGAALLAGELKGQDGAMVAVALRAARLLPGEAASKALAEGFAALPAERQAQVIQVFADRNDAASRAAVAAAAREGAPAVRLAAVRALGRIGDASSVPLLIELAAAPVGDLAPAAQASLVSLPGKDADQAIAAALAQGDPKARRIAIDAADQRRIESAALALLKAAQDPDKDVRLAAIRALRGVIGAAELPALVTIMVQSADARERSAAQSALAIACNRIAQKEQCAQALLAALPQASPQAKAALLPLLAQVGGAPSLQAIRAASADSDAAIREAALRALCERTNPDVLPDLVQLAKTSPDPRFKILALRGWLAIIPQQQASDAQKLAALKEALALTQRKEEKQLALSALAQIPTLEALALVEPCLADPELKDEAAIAAVAIAGKLAQSNPAEVAKAMRQVSSSDPKVTRAARQLLAKTRPAGAGKNGKKKKQ